MPRIARMKNLEEPTVYHVISRTCLPGYPFESVENDELLKIIRRFSCIYFVEIFGFCLLGNHHILLKMTSGKYYSDDYIKKRYVAYS